MPSEKSRYISKKQSPTANLDRNETLAVLETYFPHTENRVNGELTNRVVQSRSTI